MRRTPYLIAAAVVAVCVALVWWLAAANDSVAALSGGAAAAAGGAGTATGTGGAAGGAAGSPLTTAAQSARQAQLALAQGRYERAEQVYSSYRDATRYPHESRPIAEHPDQVHPFAPVSEENSLRKANGEALKSVRIRTTQERVFLSGAETVKFTIEATDETGTVLPMVVSSAAAQSLPESTIPVNLIRAAVSFTDDGSGADDQAGDNRYSARLNPSQQGFASFSGTIRLLAQVNVKGEAGVVHFDVIYTPEVPATWAGVREALEKGSLNFYLKVNVARPGRYVASARVDDANGQPFALLQFNDEVVAGPQEFKLTLFGALVRDKRPAFPLQLRDVDGYLLLADKFPDRQMMARQPGVVHRSRVYSPDQFSDAEWSSEERERYLAEYGKDAEAARLEVEKLQGK